MEFYKDTPKRIVRSENGEITYLVEWWCPVCDGKGCVRCKFKGCMDGGEYAVFMQVTRWQKMPGRNSR